MQHNTTTYIPVSFNSSTQEALALIKAFPFASLITVHSDTVFLTQIPLLMQVEEGKLTLLGHMARANPHSAALLSCNSPVETVVQFTGANTYISPAWYAVNTGVPTWNYENVQIRGLLNVFKAAHQTESVVKALIEAYDHQPELVKDAWAHSPAAAQSAQLNAIVAFEIQVQSLTPKAKLSQNRSSSDRLAVIQALENGSSNDAMVSLAMRKTML
jgi:transcriptional regulator